MDDNDQGEVQLSNRQEKKATCREAVNASEQDVETCGRSGGNAEDAAGAFGCS